MSERLFSVQAVADHLGLHVRTVRTYVRDGRLPAVRIGKQYRVTQGDLERFTGRPVPEIDPGAAPETGPGAAHRAHADVSSIVELDGLDRELADRLSTLLTAAARTRLPGEERVRVETVHDPARGRMKVIVVGGLADTARMLEYIEGVVGS
ncbi:helix-turn-helix domain-containing protein [Streptomyces bohaiensis]|uniref:Helix-turn-helix domain-containing protein n=1 Tax=Streptomyces bohaiensis TaxID=1431344 RepID=A0ABX1CEI7_9ACTN|nr:helix-turn-helix domain-containing protein [Streptomyces bohaiensis]NJQ15822.1 helix-turn-helix domain-containing protein [Streptomyces bohaiensis]